MYVSVRSMTARLRNRLRSDGSSRTTMTPPTTNYLDKNKSPHELTLSNCLLRMQLTKKEKTIYLPPPPGRIKDARFGATLERHCDRSIAIDNRKVSEKVSIYHRILSRIRREPRIRDSTLNVLTSSPSRLDLFYLHFTVFTLMSGLESTCR